MNEASLRAWVTSALLYVKRREERYPIESDILFRQGYRRCVRDLQLFLRRIEKVTAEE